MKYSISFMSRMMRGCLWATMIFTLGALSTSCADGEATTIGGGNNNDGSGDGGDNGNGGDDETPAGCEFSQGGECSGHTLSYCSSTGKDRIVECDEVFENGICQRTGATAWCHVPLGKECIVNTEPIDNSDEDGDDEDDDGIIPTNEARARYVRCDAEKGACVMDGYEEPAICTSGVPSCTASKVGQCLEDRYYVAGCLDGQPRAYDCEALGGHCAGSACRDIDEGSACQVKGFHRDRYMHCQSGYECKGDTDLDTWGTCVPE